MHDYYVVDGIKDEVVYRKIDDNVIHGELCSGDTKYDIYIEKEKSLYIMTVLDGDTEVKTATSSDIYYLFDITDSL